MISLVLAFALSFLVSLALEAVPPRFAGLSAPWRATALRLLLHLAIFAGAFSLSFRPWHAAFVACVIAFLFGAGSAMKARILGEPVAFSDFALVRNAIRHPRLYYAEKLAEPRWLATFAAIAVATAAWFAVEPTILPDGGWPLLALPPAVCALAIAGLRSGRASRTARALVGDTPDLDRDVARFGLGGAMTLHWLAWRGQERPSAAAIAATAAAPKLSSDKGPAIAIAIQCESFLDLAARGAPGPDLPAFRALTREAVAWGRCRVPAEGAYTMRAEFGFLTGVPTAALGFDAFDPYLTPLPYAGLSLGRRFQEAGRRTIFMHPYDRRFFDRESFVPELGFERFVDGESFIEAERFGPYVSDAAVADAILAEIERAAEPTFLFAVTIENHGPWGPGRLPGLDDRQAQYAAHLVNADRMIGRIWQALKGHPGGALLCVYGDHAPARTIHPDLADRRAADFAIWDSRDLESRDRGPQTLDIDAVGRSFWERAAGA